MHPIVAEAVELVRSKIINQVRFIQPIANGYDTDVMEIGAEEMSDEEAMHLLQNKPIISDRCLTKLVKKIGLADLYSEDAWVDSVADYIVARKSQCATVWMEIYRRGVVKLVDIKDNGRIN